MLKPLVWGPEVPVPVPSGVDPTGPEEPGPAGVDPPPDPSGAGFFSVDFPDVGSS